MRAAAPICRFTLNRRNRMTLSGIEALRASGFLKAGTPSAIASMPVSAVQPAANARSSKKNETDCSSSGTCSIAGAGKNGEPDLLVFADAAPGVFEFRRRRGMDGVEHFRPVEGDRRHPVLHLVKNFRRFGFRQCFHAHDAIPSFGRLADPAD